MRLSRFGFAARDGGYGMAWQGRKAVIVLPNREKNLGEVRADQFIVSVESRAAAGIERDFVVVDPDDPRVAGNSRST